MFYPPYLDVNFSGLQVRPRKSWTGDAVCGSRPCYPRWGERRIQRCRHAPVGIQGRNSARCKVIANWSVTSLQQRVVTSGGRLIRYARYYCAARRKPSDAAAIWRHAGEGGGGALAGGIGECGSLPNRARNGREMRRCLRKSAVDGLSRVSAPPQPYICRLVGSGLGQNKAHNPRATRRVISSHALKRNLSWKEPKRV